MIEPWNPVCTNDEAVHAHGGQILREEKYWYFIGEDRRGSARVSIYRSSNFKIWEKIYTMTLHCEIDTRFPDRDTHLITEKGNCNIERPKIIKCDKTGMYIMWMHFEEKGDYQAARVAVAYSRSIEGPYIYTGSFRPLGYMSRDLNVFKDTDGQMYMISAADDNSTLNLYRMTEDGLGIENKTATLFTGQYREAPVLFKNKGIYYLLTSGCTGWKPNQGKYSSSLSLKSGWNDLFPFADETTYKSQSTCIFEKDGQFFYLGDRWGGDLAKYFSSTYVIIPCSARNGEFRLEV